MTQRMFSHEITFLLYYLHLIALLQNKCVLGDLRINTMHDRLPDLHTGTAKDCSHPSFHMQFTKSMCRSTKLDREEKKMKHCVEHTIYLFLIYRMQNFLCQTVVCQMWLQLPIYNMKKAPNKTT